MKRFRTPQEKKLMSLENDGRNLVAESQWGARGAIAKRKQWVNRSYRKAVHDELAAARAGADPETVESAIAAQGATVGARSRTWRWARYCNSSAPGSDSPSSWVVRPNNSSKPTPLRGAA